MPLLDCAHEHAGSERYVCAHLLETRDPDYVQAFTGHGCVYRMVCYTCAKTFPAEGIPWRSVCDACFAQIEDDGTWDGICGKPEICEEPSRLRFVHRLVVGIKDQAGNRADYLRLIQPVPEAKRSLWVALTGGGALVEIELDAEHGTGTLWCIANVVPNDLPSTMSLSLTCAPDGAFICLTQTVGTFGVVIERDSGRQTLHLTRDGYHSEVSPFPVAFAVHKGRTLLIHSTAWNRLDISDSATGELLTERSPTSYERGEPRPPHYLDYFHGRLLVAPDQDYIADDGWVWHPVGVVSTWSIRRWLEENCWESEDAASGKVLAHRFYFWGGPMCWVDSRTLAIWGYGEDDQWMLPAVRLFNVASGEELHWFPGPEVDLKEKKTWHEVLEDFGGRMFFDRYLFAVSERDGVSIWNVDSGARLHQDPSFAPVAYHPATKEFLTILPDGALQLSHLVNEEE